MHYANLNFDGTLKGNPGLTSMGGVIKNHEGTILHDYARYLGEDINNNVELMVLLEGLHIAICNGSNMIVIEGDFAIIIHNYQCILNGTSLEKTSSSWKLLAMLEEISTLTEGIRVTLLSHVKRDSKRFAGYLANYNIENSNMPLDTAWNGQIPESMHRTCATLSL